MNEKNNSWYIISDKDVEKVKLLIIQLRDFLPYKDFVQNRVQLNLIADIFHTLGFALKGIPEKSEERKMKGKIKTRKLILSFLFEVEANEKWLTLNGMEPEEKGWEIVKDEMINTILGYDEEDLEFVELLGVTSRWIEDEKKENKDYGLVEAIIHTC